MRTTTACSSTVPSTICSACAGEPSACAAPVVVGGGLLGLEAADAVRRLGLDVVVVEAASRLMSRQIDANEARVSETGIRTVTGARPPHRAPGDRLTVTIHGGEGSLYARRRHGRRRNAPVTSSRGTPGWRWRREGGIVVDEQPAVSRPSCRG